MPLLETPALTSPVTAPNFQHLPGVDGKFYSLDDVRGDNGLLVMFICNHCPYVRAVAPRLAATMETLQNMGIGVIAINSNDYDTYPQDDFANMQKFAREHAFNFPYAIDESQAVARAYGAVCTPDFFGFNAELVLHYRGRFDSAGAHPATSGTVPELLNAMVHVAEHGHGPEKQYPSMGCSIKWRA